MFNGLIVNKALAEVNMVDLSTLKQLLEMNLSSDFQNLATGIAMKYNVSSRDAQLIVRYILFKRSRKDVATSPVRIETTDQSTYTNLDVEEYGGLGSSEITPLISNRLKECLCSIFIKFF